MMTRMLRMAWWLWGGGGDDDDDDDDDGGDNNDIHALLSYSFISRLLLQEFVFSTCLLHLNDYCTIFAAIGVTVLSLIAFGELIVQSTRRFQNVDYLQKIKYLRSKKIWMLKRRTFELKVSSDWMVQTSYRQQTIRFFQSQQKSFNSNSFIFILVSFNDNKK